MDNDVALPRIMNSKIIKKKFINTNSIKNNKRRLTKTFNYLKRLIVWLVNLLNIKNKIGLLSYTHSHIDKCLNIALTRGISSCIKYNKEYRLKFFKFLFKDLNPSDCDFRLPRSLIEIGKILKSEQNTNAHRAFISALYFTRSFRLKPVPNYSSITESPTYVGCASSLKDEMVCFLKELGFAETQLLGDKIPKSLHFRRYHISTKSGPNGPALWSALEDYQALPSDILDSLTVLGGPNFGDHLDTIKSLVDNDKIRKFFKIPDKKGVFRKHVLIADKEGKTREIAIGDYWSQTCLRPLHDYHNRILKRLPGDCTFNQSKLIMSLNCDEGHSYHSIDLTSATDRFPIEIQYEILVLLSNEAYANSWKKVMVGYSFDSPFGDLTYATGNPMGFYSSFSSFALSHHFFVWLASKRAGRDFHSLPYMLLGDDIVIGNDNVAKEYRQLLVEWGIPFSPEKTHTSKIGFEFAKQLRINDQNISPMSLSSLYNNRNNPNRVISFIAEEIKNKGWDINRGKYIHSYLREIQKYSPSRYNRLKPTIDLSLSILDFLQGKGTNLGSSIASIVTRFHPSPTLQQIPMALVTSNEVLRSMLKAERQKGYEDSLKFLSNGKNFKIVSLIMIIERASDLSSKCHSRLPLLAYYKNDVFTPILTNTRIADNELSLIAKFTPRLLRDIYGVDVRPVQLSDL
jgi:hypothetical protein